MAIHILDGPATAEQVADMLRALDDYIKVAVDIERGVLAGAGGGVGVGWDRSEST